MNEKPTNIDEYQKWLKEEHKIEISDRIRNYYDSVTNKMKQQFEKSRFWKQLGANLQNFNDEYYVDTGYQLLQDKKLPQIFIKPFQSFLDKTFRKNVIENNNWPEAPTNGWILPHNWYSQINDILRTLFVVKYLDGVEFMIGKMQSICEENRKHFECQFEAREEGYYAAHLYTRELFEIPRIDWDTEKVSTAVEIQITTQLQEVIRKLLHKYYEERRGKLPTPEQVWQWRYKSEEFGTNYLGHILHYVEGMIVGIREREKTK